MRLRFGCHSTLMASDAFSLDVACHHQPQIRWVIKAKNKISLCWKMFPFSNIGYTHNWGWWNHGSNDDDNKKKKNSKSQSLLKIYYVSGTTCSHPYHRKISINIPIFTSEETKTQTYYMIQSHIASKCEAWIWISVRGLFCFQFLFSPASEANNLLLNL